MGECPVHRQDGCKVFETQTEFICEQKAAAKKEGDLKSKGFSFPRVICKRTILRDELIPLLTVGETELLNGFVSKKGRKFSAKLKLLKDGGVSFAFPERVTKKKDTSKEQSEDSDSEQP